MEKNLYNILGVKKNASQDELKSAFRKLAKEHHPDRHQGEAKAVNEEKFKEIAGAYKILSDPEKRQRYDVYGIDGLRGAQGGGSGFGGFDDIFSGISDIFGDIFGFDSGGQQRGGARGHNGNDIRADVTIKFEEAAFDKIEVIEIIRKEPCKTCKGEGTKPGTTKTVCTACGGRGKVRQSQGFFTMVTTCPHCHGEGEIAEHLCDDCSGSGVVSQKRKIEVKIPAGMKNGAYLKLRGEGDAGAGGGVKGDLYVVIQVLEHNIFNREEDDVILQVPITVTQAVLGDEIIVPTLYGDEKIKINQGIGTGEVITLKGKGFPHLDSFGKGVMHIVLTVEIPTGISFKLKEAYKNVKIFESDDNYKKIKNYKNKLKKYTTGGKNG